MVDLFVLLLCLAVVAGALVLRVGADQRVWAPLVDRPLPVTCGFRLAFGRPCPGCGLTRSCVSLAHGRWTAAWRFHPAGPLIMAVVLFQIPYRAARLWRRRRGRPPWRLQAVGLWTWAVIAGVALVQWLVRLAVDVAAGR